MSAGSAGTGPQDPGPGSGTASGSGPGPDQRRASSASSSPPLRKDTTSSTSTTGTTGSTTTGATVETNNETAYGTSESVSPTYPSQAAFSSREGTDTASNRRPSRRRTGPLSASQREKAALIRKLGACNDCRRRRVACHPNHHNMSWEDAVRKYKNHISAQEYVPLAGRPTNSVQTVPASFQSEPQEMDIDTTPTPTTPYRMQHQPQQHHQQHSVGQGDPQSKLQPSPLPPTSSGRLSISSEGRLRTPLPSGRNLTSATLPGIEYLSGDVQSATARIINSANPYRSRYEAVHVQMLIWSDEISPVRAAVDELASVLEKKYNYIVDLMLIPIGVPSPYRWLLQTVTNFVNNRDSRDTLKILYYSGHSYLDAEREMVLSRSNDRTLSPTIRWSGIQQVLEDACSDTLILMDAPYYPCSKMTRREGVLELIAASAGENQSSTLGRVAFTHALVDKLQTRLSQKYRGPLAALSAAELHVRLMSDYPRILQDQSPEKEHMTSFPSPLHLQISANARLPSILLAPCRKPLPPTSPEMQGPGTQINFTVRLADGGVDKAGWVEWMRLLPEGVQEVKCESPFRNTFR